MRSGCLQSEDQKVSEGEEIGPNGAQTHSRRPALCVSFNDILELLLFRCGVLCNPQWWALPDFETADSSPQKPLLTKLGK